MRPPLRGWKGGLKAKGQLFPSKHQVFKSHAPHLPEFALFLIGMESALPIVIEGHGHLKHGIVFIVEHCNFVLGELEGYGPLQIL